MNAKYELVLQFALAPRDVAAFNRVARVEEELAKASMLYRIDDGDCTEGKAEIVVLTDDPDRAARAIRDVIPPSCGFRQIVRASSKAASVLVSSGAGGSAGSP